VGRGNVSSLGKSERAVSGCTERTDKRGEPRTSLKLSPTLRTGGSLLLTLREVPEEPKAKLYPRVKSDFFGFFTSLPSYCRFCTATPKSRPSPFRDGKKRADVRRRTILLRHKGHVILQSLHSVCWARLVMYWDVPAKFYVWRAACGSRLKYRCSLPNSCKVAQLQSRQLQSRHLQAHSYLQL
jgi:hypothetical protein